MPVENIAKNIYRIPVPLGNTPLKELNAYLIKGDGRYLLIDTGFRREDCRIPLLEGLAEIGVDLEKMDIFLTHCLLCIYFPLMHRLTPIVMYI